MRFHIVLLGFCAGFFLVQAWDSPALVQSFLAHAPATYSNQDIDRYVSNGIKFLLNQDTGAALRGTIAMEPWSPSSMRFQDQLVPLLKDDMSPVLIRGPDGHLVPNFDVAKVASLLKVKDGVLKRMIQADTLLRPTFNPKTNQIEFTPLMDITGRQSSIQERIPWAEYSNPELSRLANKPFQVAHPNFEARELNGVTPAEQYTAGYVQRRRAEFASRNELDRQRSSVIVDESKLQEARLKAAQVKIDQWHSYLRQVKLARTRARGSTVLVDEAEVSSKRRYGQRPVEEVGGVSDPTEQPLLRKGPAVSDEATSSFRRQGVGKDENRDENGLDLSLHL